MVDAELKSKVQQYLIKKTDFLKVKDKLNEEQLRVFVDKAITDMCYEEEIHLPNETRFGLIRELVSAVVSLGPIRPLMEDKTISEILGASPFRYFFSPVVISPAFSLRCSSFEKK